MGLKSLGKQLEISKVGGRMVGAKKRKQHFSEDITSNTDPTAGEAEWARAGAFGEYAAGNTCIGATAGETPYEAVR